MLRALYVISSFFISYKYRSVKFRILFRPKLSSIFFERYEILSHRFERQRLFHGKSEIIYNLERINFKRYFHLRIFFIVLTL